MKPARFDYHAPRSVGEARELLGAHAGAAKVLAGGQSLVPLMNVRAIQPGVVVDINRVRELAYVRGDGAELRIGALTRHFELAAADEVVRHAPLLARAAALVGHPAVRHRGTLGGSLAHALPAGELPCAAVAMGARVRVAGPAGEREIEAGRFFTGAHANALAAPELIVEVAVPRPPAAGWAFAELSPRRRDFPLVSVAVLLELAGGAVASARIAVGGASDRPLRAPAAEESLAGAAPGGPAYSRAAAAAAGSLRMVSDARAGGRYREQVTRALVERTLHEAERELAARSGRPGERRA